jgi:hypothetical protein
MTNDIPLVSKSIYSIILNTSFWVPRIRAIMILMEVHSKLINPLIKKNIMVLKLIVIFSKKCLIMDQNKGLSHRELIKIVDHCG